MGWGGWRQMIYFEGSVGALQLVALLHALAPAILRVAAVLERAPLLLEAHHLLAREPVEFLVELAHRQRDELVVVQEVHAARAGPQADHQTGAAAAAATAAAAAATAAAALITPP